MNTFRRPSPVPHRDRLARAADRILAHSASQDDSPSESDKTQTQPHDILLDSTLERPEHAKSNDPLYTTPSLPPVTRHMHCYAMRSAQRFRPSQSCHGDAPNALELRFVERSIGKHSGETDMSMMDAQQGLAVFNRGINALSDNAVRAAVLAKRSDRESRRLRALTTAWELDATERHAILLQTILLNDAQKYAESMVEASFFEKLLVKRNRTQLEDDADFGIAAYTHDFTEYTVADEQLEQLENVADQRNLPLPYDDPTPEIRLNTYLESIFADMGNPESQVAAV